MKTETEVVREKSPSQKLIDQLDVLAQSGKYLEVALCTSKGCIFSWQKYRLQNLQASRSHGGNVWGFVCVSGGEDPVQSIVQSTVWPLGDEHGELESVDKIMTVQCLLVNVSNVWEAWEDSYRLDNDLVNLEWEFCPKCDDVINDDF